MLRETVETLLQDGDVYVTDWANARDVPLAAGPFGLDDYVLAVERFLRKLGCAHTHVIAVCQATAPTLAAAALLEMEGEAPPLSLTLMGGPIDTRLNPTAVDRMAQSHSLDWFRDTVIDTVPPRYAGSGRRVCPGFIQHAAIVAAHPHRQLALESRYWSSRLSVDATAIANSLRSLNEYAAALDMTEDYLLDTIRVIFQEQHLACGEWRVGGAVCSRRFSHPWRFVPSRATATTLPARARRMPLTRCAVRFRYRSAAVGRYRIATTTTCSPARGGTR